MPISCGSSSPARCCRSPCRPPALPRGRQAELARGMGLSRPDGGGEYRRRLMAPPQRSGAARRAPSPDDPARPEALGQGLDGRPPVALEQLARADGPRCRSLPLVHCSACRTAYRRGHALRRRLRDFACGAGEQLCRPRGQDSEGARPRSSPPDRMPMCVTRCMPPLCFSCSVHRCRWAPE